MRKMIKYGILGLMTFLISGCFGNQPERTAKDIVYERPEVKYDDFEKEIVLLATKAERNWNEYTALLTERKELKDVSLSKHIPVGMGSVSNINFQGYLGNFLKLVGEKAGYAVEFENLSIIDTPIIVVDKSKTILYEILRSTIEKHDYDLKILESERRLILSIKV